ncbi:hypothetical protein BT96DRAFT_924229 [Gymnopus androsaceus JB14]|uniref:F-box domain-containing protein n=1 Tax=Gymnopus androsaceus JB14 TaxID=1447944 RepID=A0A6A4H7N3_9AGAR|nr:hypothetical protein BT96DRAFT_924229 [Gymnopus androsaceus JB14]
MSAERKNLCSLCKKSVLIPRIDIDSSDLYTRLRSESGPSVFERQDIEDLLLLCDRDDDDYEIELAHLKSRILFIGQQQNRLAYHKEKLRSLSSPIRKLPNEILRLIFDYACQSESNLLQEFPWSLESEDPPTTVSSPITFLPALSISATCSRWRTVATSTPSLWSRLKLEISSCRNSPKSATGFTDALELYLRRSKECSLDIDLYVAGDDDSDDSPLALTLLIQQSIRWKSLQFGGSSFIDSHIRQGTEFPLLERIEIEPQFEDGERLSIFQNAPMLSQVNIDYLGLDKIIDLSPNLTSLTLWEHLDYRTDLVSPARIVNPLSDLTIHVRNAGTGSGLLEQISFFLHASIISFHGICISHPDLISSLYLMPLLQELIISNGSVPEDRNPITTEFIASLDISRQHKSRFPLVPRLRRIFLKFKGINFDDAAFISMVSSRWIPDSDYAAKINVYCLRSVVLKFLSRKVDETVYKPLRYFDRMGMMVVVTGTEDE